MTQIVQGKNRELQPLVDRRRNAQPSFAALYPPQNDMNEQGQFYETPKKEVQYAFGDQDLMNTQDCTPLFKEPVETVTTPFDAYEDIPMRYASPARATHSLHPFAQMSSPAKVGVRMQQIEKNDFQPNTPQFTRPSMKMNLTMNHCQSAAQPR